MSDNWEREEYRCAFMAAEDAGEFDSYYQDREDARRDMAEWEADGPDEGFDDE